MEKANGFSRRWVASGEVRTFVKVAVSARESKVFAGGLTTVLSGDDMFDMKGSVGLVLGK